VLKSDDLPRADESYRYGEAGLSQQACAVLSEITRALVVETWKVLIPICRVLYSIFGGGTPEISETHPAIAHRINTVTFVL
jgi:hypothetical protein